MLYMYYTSWHETQICDKMWYQCMNLPLVTLVSVPRRRNVPWICCTWRCATCRACTISSCFASSALCSISSLQQKVNMVCHVIQVNNNNSNKDVTQNCDKHVDSIRAVLTWRRSAAERWRSCDSCRRSIQSPADAAPPLIGWCEHVAQRRPMRVGSAADTVCKQIQYLTVLNFFIANL